MKFDPADLKVLASQISAIFGGKASPTAGGVTMNMGGPAGAAGSGSSNPSFMSIFKPLAFLELINKGISFIVKNSSVANTYLGVMGKVFGAAMDLLLIPFLPILNLLLVGLGKLVEWLARDDVQKYLSKLADGLLKGLENIFNIINDVYKAIDALLHGDWATAWDAIKDAANNLISFLTEGSPVVIALKLLTAAIIANKALGIAGSLLPFGGLFGKAATGGAGSVGSGLLAPLLGGAAVGGVVGGGVEQGLEHFGVIRKGSLQKGIQDTLGIKIPGLQGWKEQSGSQKNGPTLADVPRNLDPKSPSYGMPIATPNANTFTVGNQTVTINVAGVNDSRTVAQMVADEFTKISRGVILH